MSGADLASLAAGAARNALFRAASASARPGGARLTRADIDDAIRAWQATLARHDPEKAERAGACGATPTGTRAAGRLGRLGARPLA
ncbi:hypothetical protein [Roseivivax jejudonensis]|uniref:hypothetical protein n=1 Tax=Roseivivax jejudonensis TaxID=1529041 RepID=UPI00351FC898